jgi:nicotinamide riboside kinase
MGMEKNKGLSHSIKIAVVGPESCGKSTLAKQLTVLLEGILVPEFARFYLENKAGKYHLEDLIHIHEKQLELEQDALSRGNRFIVCDTTPLVIEIWATEVFGKIPSEISNSHQPHSYAFYLLCAPDIPWVPDRLRENPNDRERLFVLYQKKIDELKVPYGIVTGQSHQRLLNAYGLIKTFLQL